MPPKDEVAVVGLSVRFPLAEDIGAFWQNLREGKDCITEAPKKRWNYRGVLRPRP